MTSKLEGELVTPVWSDDGVIKPIVQADGHIDVDVENLPTTIQARLYGWDTSDWRKNPILLGYTDTYQDSGTEEATAPGTLDCSLDAIAEGYVVTVQSIVVRHNKAGGGTVFVFDVVSAGHMIIGHEQALAQWDSIKIHTPITLKEGDYIKGRLESAIIGDDIWVYAVGYQSKINE